MRNYIAILLVSIFFLAHHANGQSKIEWLTFEEAQERMQDEKRKIFVDMYTDWCGYCKKMDKITFQDSKVIEYINANYYPVKFDAETKNDIVFDGKTFSYVKAGRKGYNQLAAEFSKQLGRLSFPTMVFIDYDLSVIQAIATYMDPNNFEVVMTFFGEDHYKTTPWKRYYQNYNNGKNFSNK